MPLFSVVIPLYNKEQNILNTLRSVLDQDLDDFEIVLIDDGSTDHSLDKVKQIEDTRLKVYAKTNEGVGPTRNFGLEKASGDLVAFMDADDLWLPHHLSDLRQLAIDFPDAGWYCTAYSKRFNKKLTLALESSIMDRHPWSGVVEDYFGACLTESIAWTSAVCFKKELLKELKGFDTTITHGAGEDTDLWIRAALISRPAFTTRISAVYNLEGENRISFTPTRKRRFMDPDQYEEQAQKVPNLKKYLDQNRFSYGLRHKIASQTDAYNKMMAKLDRRNLNYKQRMLLSMPGALLKLAMGAQRLLSLTGIRLTPFK